ncbi:MAG: glycerophosphodiester phosphodiesterase [Acidimicrobiia bacterium]
MSDYFSIEHPIRLAHRGSRVLWPENTMFAFAGAVEELDYHYLELDVRLTADRIPVVFHDATLERTTSGTGKIADYTLEELQSFDAAYHFDPDHDYPLRGTGIGISPLEELYRTWPDVRLNVDLKASGEEWAVAEVIRAADAEHRTLIGSFYDRRIARFRRITQGQVAVSAGPTAAAAMWSASRGGRTTRRRVQAYQLPFNYRGFKIDEKLIDSIHRAGAHIHLWTVNEPDDMRRFLDMGVDGIVTDRPDILNDVMGA